MENPSQSYGASPAIRDHSVTCHLNLSQSAWSSIFLHWRLKAELTLVLATRCLQKVTHPSSKYPIATRPVVKPTAVPDHFNGAPCEKQPHDRFFVL